MNKKIVVIVASVLSLGIIGTAVYANVFVDDPSPADTIQQVESETSEQQSVESDAIAFSEDGKTASYAGVVDEVALTTLKSLTEVQTQDSAYGEFVTSINGVSADSSKEYWAFYVNGAYANEGAGTYKAKAGDSFEWKLEALQQ